MKRYARQTIEALAICAFAIFSPCPIARVLACLMVIAFFIAINVGRARARWWQKDSDEWRSLCADYASYIERLEGEVERLKQNPDT